MIGRMERLVDIAVMLGASVSGLALAAVCGMEGVGAVGAAHVVCLLVAVIVTALSELGSPRMGAFGPAVYCVLAASHPEGLLFLPLATYELTRSVRDSWPIRALAFAPAFALVAAVALGVAVESVLFAALLSLCAAALSMRTSDLLAQRSVSRRAYDELRSRELGGRNRVDVHHAPQGVPAGSISAISNGCAPSDESASSAHLTGSTPPSSSAAPARPLAFASLSEREYEVVRLVAMGLDNHEIAAAAFISEGTVRNRISSVLQKTGLKNRTQLAVTWWQTNAR